MMRWCVGAVLALACACGGDDDGGGETCEAFSGCGGDPTGTWTFADVCVEGEFDPGIEGCTDATAIVTDSTISGTVLFAADETYSLDQTIGGTLLVTVPMECLQGRQCEDLSEDAGAPCVANEAGCECSGDFEVSTEETGTWDTSASTLTLTPDGELSDAVQFCVEGDVARVQDTSDTGTSTIVMNRGG